MTAPSTTRKTRSANGCRRSRKRKVLPPVRANRLPHCSSFLGTVPAAAVPSRETRRNRRTIPKGIQGFIVRCRFVRRRHCQLCFQCCHFGGFFFRRPSLIANAIPSSVHRRRDVRLPIVCLTGSWDRFSGCTRICRRMGSFRLCRDLRTVSSTLVTVPAAGQHRVFLLYYLLY